MTTMGGAWLCRTARYARKDKDGATVVQTNRSNGQEAGPTFMVRGRTRRGRTTVTIPSSRPRFFEEHISGTIEGCCVWWTSREESKVLRVVLWMTRATSGRERGTEGRSQLDFFSRLTFREQHDGVLAAAPTNDPHEHRTTSRREDGGTHLIFHPGSSLSNLSASCPLSPTTTSLLMVLNEATGGAPGSSASGPMAMLKGVEGGAWQS